MSEHVAVYIGRFQPFHNGHYATVKHALAERDRLLILLGSGNVACNAKNPWTPAEREEMVRATLTKEEEARVWFRTIRDYLFDDAFWVQEVVNAERETFGHQPQVSLIGYHKDSSSYYLNLFPDWHSLGMIPVPNTDATETRRLYFDGKGYEHMVPPAVAAWMASYRDRHPATHDRLQREHWHIKEYRKVWGGTPFPVIFSTADAVVTCNGHVLVVTRKDPPGEGLLALPGGFVREEETVLEAALRELHEETRILMARDDLKRSLRGTHVFDSPGRSLRGRTITHAHHFDLDSLKFAPTVAANDDAAQARWMPLFDVYARERDFFEDHWQIVNYFTHRNK